MGTLRIRFDWNILPRRLATHFPAVFLDDSWDSGEIADGAQRGYKLVKKAARRMVRVFPILLVSLQVPVDLAAFQSQDGRKGQNFSLDLTAQTPAPPPLREFGGQLVRNFRGLFVEQNVTPLIAGLTGTGMAAAYDEEIQNYFGQTRRVKELGDIGDVVGNPFLVGALSGVMLLWGYNSDSDHLRGYSFTLAQGFVVDFALTAALKAPFDRTRPDLSNDNSFPSGHSSTAFMAATVTAHYYKKAAIPAFVVAGLIGASRIEKNRHYLSDVAAGATVGYLVGRTVIRGTESMRPRRITWLPVVPPEGGFAVTAAILPENP